MSTNYCKGTGKYVIVDPVFPTLMRYRLCNIYQIQIPYFEIDLSSSLVNETLMRQHIKFGTVILFSLIGY